MEPTLAPNELAVDQCLQIGTKQGLKIMTDKHTTLTGFLDNTLDVVFHVAILFTALVLLLQFIIAPLYTAHLTDNVTGSLDAAMHANLKLTTSQKNAVRAAAPALQAMYRMSAEPSPEVATNNNWLFTYAHTVSIFLFLIFGIMVWAFFRLLKSGNVAGPTIKVLRNNLLLIFPAILMAEYAFFVIIASKMPPMLPSDVLTMLQEIVQLRLPAVSVTL
jgi:hypothetical protein